MKLWIGSALFRAIEGPLKGGGSPATRLHRLIHRQLRFIGRRPGIPRLLRSDRLHLANPALRRTITRIVARYRTEVAQVIREGIARGEFRRDVDPDQATRVLAMMVQGVVITWSLSEFSFRLERATDDIWGMLWPALRADRAPGGIQAVPGDGYQLVPGEIGGQS